MPRKPTAPSKGGRKALGKGLSALLPPAAQPQAAGDGAASEGVLQVALDNIHPNPEQPRKQFDADGITEMAESIRELGVLQPLVVRPAKSGYEIVVGERRYRAARELGLERVPVQVVRADDERSFLMALVENVQREDLGPLEEAEAYRHMVEAFGLSQEAVAQKVGKDRSTVANALRILKLPRPVKAAIAAGELTAGHARPLLSLPPSRIEAVARQVIARGLSVRATENLVRKLRDEGGDPGPARPKPRSPAVQELEEQLCRGLGTRVRLKTGRKNAGKIEITYHNLDELDRLLEVLLP